MYEMLNAVNKEVEQYNRLFSEHKSWTQILSRRAIKPLVWKRYIDDIFSLWVHTEQEVSLSLGLTISTRQSNSRLKSLKIIQHFWILPSRKATDLQRNQSLTANSQVLHWGFQYCKRCDKCFQSVKNFVVISAFLYGSWLTRVFEKFQEAKWMRCTSGCFDDRVNYRCNVGVIQVQ